MSRDLSSLNILLDKKGRMFPKGFHPINQICKPNVHGWAESKRRRGARGIKYMIIDFGISSQFGSREERKLVAGRVAQDPTIPELSLYRRYDPFAVDVYTLGKVYKMELLRVRREYHLRDVNMAE